MRIQLNGAWRELATGADGAAGAGGAASQPLAEAAPTLASMLQLCGYGDATVATAVNGQFVAVRERTATCLQDGDRVEVLAPMQGG